MAQSQPVPSRVVDAAIGVSLQHAEQFISWGRGVMAVLLFLRFLATGMRHPNGWQRASLEVPAMLVAIACSVWLARRARSRTLTHRLALLSVILDAGFAFASLLTNVLWPWPSYEGLFRLPDIGAVLIVAIVAGLRPIASSAVVGSLLAIVLLLVLAGIDMAMNGSRIAYGWGDVGIIMLYVAGVGAASVFSVRRVRRLALMAANKSAHVVWARRGLSAVLQDHHDVGSLLMSATFNLEGSLRLLHSSTRREEELCSVLHLLKADLTDLALLVHSTRERAFSELSHASGRKPAQLRRAVESATAHVQQRFSDRTLTTLVSVDVDVLLLGGLPSLERLVYNLLVNACEGNGVRHASSITVRADSTNGHGVITVEDDGPGIDPILVDAQSVAASSKLTGSGLGLFLCRRTVSASGGCFSIHNRTGGGCIVRLELPLDDGLPPDSTESCPESSRFVNV